MTSDHGTYRLSYTPPESKGNEYYPNITIEMSMDGEASVNHMLRFYEAFLAASGYVLKGELQVAEPGEEPRKSPYDYVPIAGGGSSDYIPFGFGGNNVIYGGASTDTISFGAAQPAMEFGAKTWDDVISFG
jgi:hypothetical protein